MLSSDRLQAGHTRPPTSLDAKCEPESSEAVEPRATGDEPFWDDDDFLEYLAEAPMPEPQVSIGDSVCDWDTLERRVAACTACPLHGSRTQTVFGVGDRNADWMVIGEAPGE
ncbi:MAG: uracil-DNA glycosylase, partial [Proteobacteria bacterium]|nr:uracil-DNA glycosylase [Pseudomonadota bacterium]